MLVERIQKIETEDFQIGDRITISLDGLGQHTATAWKITDKGTCFMFDNYINVPLRLCANGYVPDYYRSIDEILTQSFLPEIKKRIIVDDPGSAFMGSLGSFSTRPVFWIAKEQA